MFLSLKFLLLDIGWDLNMTILPSLFFLLLHHCQLPSATEASKRILLVFVVGTKAVQRCPWQIACQLWVRLIGKDSVRRVHRVASCNALEYVLVFILGIARILLSQ